jgi:ADP-heptose:LPS heptosyltransferase
VKNIPKNAKILLIKLRSIGDVVYNTAVYSPIKRCFPDTHLTVVVDRASYDLVCDHPDVDEVLCFEKEFLWKQVKFYARLICSRYDVAIDMHEGPRGAVMCFLTRAPIRIGNKFAKRSFLYNTKLNFSDLNPKFPIDYQAALIKKMGVHFDHVEPAIYISESARHRARDLLTENGIQSGYQYCVIHPGTKKVYDQWQYEKFSRLAEIIPKKYKIKVVLTCGPDEVPQIKNIIRLSKGSLVPYIQTGLQELTAVTQGATFVLCHNGGYMHLASALGTPVIALFGVVHPEIWKPLGEKDQVIYKNIECSPCYKHTRKLECYEGDAECKRVIEIEDVLEAIEKILSNNDARKNIM